MTAAKTNIVCPLDPDTEAPFYRQIYERFRNAIASGLLKPGDRIPSARALTKELGLARGTIETAYSLLAAEGYIEAHGQAGTIVTPGLKTIAPVALQLPQSKTSAAEVSFRPESILPFQMGLPALDAFPRKIWARLGARCVRAMQPSDMVHPSVYGLPALRNEIAAYLQVSRGIDCSPSQVFVTSGYRHTIELIAHTLLKGGDRVWLEDPGYPPTREILRHMNIGTVPVRVDREGMVISDGIRAAPSAQAAVSTPAHQSPLGVSLALPGAWHCWTRQRKNNAWIEPWHRPPATARPAAWTTTSTPAPSTCSPSASLHTGTGSARPRLLFPLIPGRESCKVNRLAFLGFVVRPLPRLCRAILAFTIKEVIEHYDGVRWNSNGSDDVRRPIVLRYTKSRIEWTRQTQPPPLHRHRSIETVAMGPLGEGLNQLPDSPPRIMAPDRGCWCQCFLPKELPTKNFDAYPLTSITRSPSNLPIVSSTTLDAQSLPNATPGDLTVTTIPSERPQGLDHRGTGPLDQGQGHADVPVDAEYLLVGEGNLRRHCGRKIVVHTWHVDVLPTTLQLNGAVRRTFRENGKSKGF